MERLSARYRRLLFLLPAFGPLPVLAQDSLVSFSSVSPETALEIADAAMAACREEGYQVVVAVVDRLGVTQVLLRDRFAGPHTPRMARSKAYTAVSFRTNTTALAEATQAGRTQSGVRGLPGVAAVGGGLMIEAGGSLIGGIGVSGAPGGREDDVCAAAGIAAVREDLEL